MSIILNLKRWVVGKSAFVSIMMALLFVSRSDLSRDPRHLNLTQTQICCRVNLNLTAGIGRYTGAVVHLVGLGKWKNKYRSLVAISQKVKGLVICALSGVLRSFSGRGSFNFNSVLPVSAFRVFNAESNSLFFSTLRLQQPKGGKFAPFKCEIWILFYILYIAYIVFVLYCKTVGKSVWFSQMSRWENLGVMSSCRCEDCRVAQFRM